ncbi:hypothetical protein Ddc_03541 [Ditylenchus destructor]|nr:hypothetical protein Ddc_03541 [Ditylenchus destructor]
MWCLRTVVWISINAKNDGGDFLPVEAKLSLVFEIGLSSEFLVEVGAIAQSRLAVVHALRHHQFADVRDQCQREICAHRNAHKATLPYTYYSSDVNSYSQQQTYAQQQTYDQSQGSYSGYQTAGNPGCCKSQHPEKSAGASYVSPQPSQAYTREIEQYLAELNNRNVNHQNYTEHDDYSKVHSSDHSKKQGHEYSQQEYGSTVPAVEYTQHTVSEHEDIDAAQPQTEYEKMSTMSQHEEKVTDEYSNPSTLQYTRSTSPTTTSSGYPSSSGEYIHTDITSVSYDHNFSTTHHPTTTPTKAHTYRAPPAVAPPTDTYIQAATSASTSAPINTDHESGKGGYRQYSDVIYRKQSPEVHRTEPYLLYNDQVCTGVTLGRSLEHTSAMLAAEKCSQLNCVAINLRPMLTNIDHSSEQAKDGQAIMEVIFLKTVDSRRVTSGYNCIAMMQVPRHFDEKEFGREPLLSRKTKLNAKAAQRRRSSVLNYRPVYSRSVKQTVHETN